MTTTEFLYWLLVQQSAWISGAISLYMTWMMGNKKWWAPFLGLFGQVFWAFLAWLTGQPGLLLTVIGFTIVHGRNAYKWWREKREAEAEDDRKAQQHWINAVYTGGNVAPVRSDSGSHCP